MKKNLVPHSFFVKLPVFLTVTLGLIALDWYTISSLFGAFSSEDSSMILCGTLALAVAIDVGPMVLAHFLADRLRAKTIAVICTIACVFAFAAAMTGEPYSSQFTAIGYPEPIIYCTQEGFVSSAGWTSHTPEAWVNRISTVHTVSRKHRR